MLFPVIKVHDKQGGHVHIVGTDSHDMLLVDRSGLIKYYNLQNGEGTGEHGDYTFIGEKDEYYGMTIEFVTFDELEEIYVNEKFEAEVRQKKQQELLDSLLKKRFVPTE